MSGSQQLLLGGIPTAVPVDPYFYSVTSLLHGDGTNGGQNNTFLDSSSNNFTITRNGNTTQGSFSPFSQTGWSNYFDGTGDYLTTNATQAIPATGDFTVDGWIWCNSYANGPSIISQGTAGTIGRTLIYITTAGKLALQITSTLNEFGSAIPTNQWVYFAITRTGSTVTAYINNSSIGTATNSGSIENTTLTIGGEWNADPYRWIGYLSNIRVSNVVRTITAAPTAPFTSDANTVVLTCQANRFIDASSNAYTITRNGDVSVQAFSPFNPITPYSTSSIGGSGYFDGSGDYLTVASNSAFDMGSGDFTVEFWLYPTSLSGTQVYVTRANNSSTYPSFEVNLISSTIGLYTSSTGSSYNVSLSSSVALKLNAWNHVAATRNGSTFTIWVNGASGGTATSALSLTANGNSLGVGGYPSGTNIISGYLADVRIVKGTAVYTSAFTPPTAPLTAISGTSLLTNFTNGAIFDNAAVADYETVGNAQISTSVKKYGTGSIAFDGTGDWLVAPASPSWDFGSGDFTVELWINPSATTAGEALVSKGNASSTGNEVWTLQWFGTNQLAFFSGGGLGTPVVNTGSVFATGNWYHVAVCRAAGVTKIFVNGTVQGTSTTSYTITAGGALYVGAGWFAPASRDISGYIDDLRISKGVARYPYNFTPPTAEFPNIGGTVTLTADPYFDYTTLLLPGNGTNGAQNNTFLDSSTNAFSITRNGNTTQGTFSPFSQTGWGNYFDGTGDYLTLSSNASMNFGTGNFTIEGWFYTGDKSVSVGASRTIIGNSGNSYTMQVYLSTAGYLTFGNTGSTFLQGSTDLANNAWHHFAVSRSGTGSNQIAMWVDGNRVALGTNSQNYTSGTIYLGAFDTGNGFWNGYVSNLRIVKGSSVYDPSSSTITVPTAPLTAITNTSLLTCQSNRFVDNSSNAFAITRNGDVSVQAFSPFNPTAAWSASTNGGSGYFDGSGDYLTVPDNAAFDFGSGDFTISAWVYPQGAGGIIDQGGGGASSNRSFEIYMSSASSISNAYISSDGTYQAGYNLTGTTVPNAWNFIELTRASGTLRLFVNGVQQSSVSANVTIFNSTATVAIGNTSANAVNPYTGYISDVRVLKGTGSATSTVPTAPLTAITNTQLLTNFTNAGIYDATSKNDLETVGNAQISTTQSKFGGSSMYFDGSGDQLNGYGVTTNLNLLSGSDFTIEFWMRPDTIAPAASGYSCILGMQYYAGSVGYGVFQVNATISAFFNGSTTQVTTGNVLAAGTWAHVAITRYNGTVRIFVNGVLSCTPTSASNSNTTSSYPLTVGGVTSTTGWNADYPYAGYLQDVRITKGIARYTSNFTPPTTAFLTL